MVRDDSLARALTRRTHREIMDRLRNMPAITKTRPGARRKQVLRQVENALAGLLVYRTDVGKGMHAQTRMLAVVPSEHGRFDITLFLITMAELPQMSVLMQLSEHAMARLMQREVNLTQELEWTCNGLLIGLHEMSDVYSATSEEIFVKMCEYPDAEMFTLNGRLVMKVEQNLPLAVTWIADAWSSPAKQEVLKRYRAESWMFVPDGTE